jgi:hypothetical protein
MEVYSGFGFVASFQCGGLSRDFPSAILRLCKISIRRYFEFVLQKILRSTILVPRRDDTE